MGFIAFWKMEVMMPYPVVMTDYFVNVRSHSCILFFLFRSLVTTVFLKNCKLYVELSTELFVLGSLDSNKVVVTIIIYIQVCWHCVNLSSGHRLLERIELVKIFSKSVLKVRIDAWQVFFNNLNIIVASFLQKISTFSKLRNFDSV